MTSHQRNHQNANRAFVLLASYLLVHAVGVLSLPFELYYLSLALTCLVVISLCINTNDYLLIGYACIQLSAMVCYVGMISGYYDAFDYAMYSGAMNIASIMILYELIIFMFIGGACVRIITDRMRNGVVRSIYVNQGDNKA